MKAFWRTIVFAGLISVLIYSCTEERHTRPCDNASPPCGFDTAKVNIRILNFTKYPLCNFTLHNSNKKDSVESMLVGLIERDSTTCYFAVDSALLGAGISYDIGSEHFDAERTSAKWVAEKGSFLTYHVFLEQRIDTLPNGVINRYYVTFQRASIDIL